MTFPYTFPPGTVYLREMKGGGTIQVLNKRMQVSASFNGDLIWHMSRNSSHSPIIVHFQFITNERSTVDLCFFKLFILTHWATHSSSKHYSRIHCRILFSCRIVESFYFVLASGSCPSFVSYHPASILEFFIFCVQHSTTFLLCVFLLPIHLATQRHFNSGIYPVIYLTHSLWSFCETLNTGNSITTCVFRSQLVKQMSFDVYSEWFLLIWLLFILMFVLYSRLRWEEFIWKTLVLLWYRLWALYRSRIWCNWDISQFLEYFFSNE